MSGLGRQSPPKEEQLLAVGELLVRHGADVEAKGMFYGPLAFTPLDMLAHTGASLRLARFLIASGAKISTAAFLEALSHRGRSVAEGMALAELFLASGFDINTPKEDRTALHASANSGGLPIVKWLLAHGADVHVRGRMGRTPLHLAAERNMSSKIVDVLIKNGADVNAKDDLGFTALEVAEQYGKTAVADYLRGCSPTK